MCLKALEISTYVSFKSSSLEKEKRTLLQNRFEYEVHFCQVCMKIIHSNQHQMFVFAVWKLWNMYFSYTNKRHGYLSFMYVPSVSKAQSITKKWNLKSLTQHKKCFCVYKFKFYARITNLDTHTEDWLQNR